MKAITQKFGAAVLPMRDRIAVMWLARTEQERKFLTVGAIILGITFFYLTLLAPAIDGRAQLRKSLPALRQQAAQLRTLSDEARMLAIILTGASADGAAGLARVRQLGGSAWVQEPQGASCAIMPISASTACSGCPPAACSAPCP